MYMFLQRQGLNSMTKQRTLGFSKAYEIHLLLKKWFYPISNKPENNVHCF